MNGDDLSEHDKTELKVSLREYFERLLREHEKAHIQLAKSVDEAHDDQRNFDQRVAQLENFRNRATGAGVVLALIAGVVGATVMKVLGG